MKIVMVDIGGLEIEIQAAEAEVGEMWSDGDHFVEKELRTMHGESAR